MYHCACLIAVEICLGTTRHFHVKIKVFNNVYIYSNNVDKGLSIAIVAIFDAVRTKTIITATPPITCVTYQSQRITMVPPVYYLRYPSRLKVSCTKLHLVSYFKW